MAIYFEQPDTSDEDALELKALLHPANAFAHPRDVVGDADLTINEKRAILASWASDACAVESAPALRTLSATSRPVTFDEVMDALRVLDEKARSDARPIPHYRRVLAKRHRSAAESNGRPRTN
jgi:hypothetical protein